MNKLKKIIICIAIIITLVLMIATFVDNSKGSFFAHTYIYSSIWFVVLWALFACTSITYVIRRKLYKRIPVFLVHVAFVVILLGAFTSWLTSESGDIYLRKGIPTNEMITKNQKTVLLDFSLKLKEFKVIYYPGTDAAMDYVSELTTGNETINISMNNIGEYKGYRFTQAGYDDDMQGTHLGVYYDPWGICITYIGYILLFISFIVMLFNKHTRIRRLYQHAIDPQKAKTTIIAALLAIPVFASQVGAQELKKIDEKVANDFGKICVLYNSRICPINTVATTFVTKLSGKPTWNGMSANQIFAGWIFDVANWENAKMIEINNKETQKVLGIDDKWASFSDFWNEYNEYKLEKPLNDAYRTGNKDMQKKLRDADEKFNVIRMLYNGEMLRMFPYTDRTGQQ